MSNLLQGLLLVFAVFFNVCGPAVKVRPAAVFRDRDPSYAIYQKYRYAYQTYGYLFLRGDGENFGGAAGEITGPEVSSWEPGVESGQLPGMTSGAGSAGELVGESAGKSTVEQTAELAAGPAGQLVSGLPALAQLQDYDYLMKHFYSVHPSTTASRDLMRAEMLLGTDLTLDPDSSVPQILIYHTHSQETYADYGPYCPQATVVSVGTYLAQLLSERGWNVIHDTNTYDIQGGKLDRNRAYNYALDGISGILQSNPTIQVILDLHRDGVKESTRLVSEINGKPTANIMFFQGMSRTPEGVIEYLPNPYLEENLAFSFQMQYLAAGNYPGLTRKIYLKGLRYNLHLRPRSSLIEVGAQTNTLQEALNAMEPLAELLDIVLRGN